MEVREALRAGAKFLQEMEVSSIMATQFLVFGDIHGEQHRMYEEAMRWEDKHQCPIDAILQVGDFETIRTNEDFIHYYAPPKYCRISDFADYVTGVKEAPFLTVFTGGNHEAWGVLEPHNDGGYVATNMFYLGRAGILDLDGVRVGGLTGLFHPKHYRQPLGKPSHRWKYYREQDVDKLSQERLDILLLHEWIEPIGAVEAAVEINVRDFLNRRTTPAYHLTLQTRPKYVFMGHHHSSYIEGKLGESIIYGLQKLDRARPYVAITFNK